MALGRSAGCGRRAGAAREPWLGGVRVQDTTRARSSTGSPATAGHQGICAEVAPYAYAEPPAARRRGAADRRARPGPGPAESRRRRPQRRMCRSDAAWSSPSAARPRSPRRCARPRPARSSTCRSPGFAISPTSCATRRPPARGATGRTPSAARPYDGDRSRRADRARARLRGEGAAAAGGRELRCAARAARPGADRLPQCVRRGDRSALRRASCPRTLDNGALLCQARAGSEDQLKV